jgi:hypothetical protein
MSPSAYVLKTLKDIRPSELDEALLILPFSIVVTFFHYLESWARYSLSLSLSPSLPPLSPLSLFLLPSPPPPPPWLWKLTRVLGGGGGGWAGRVRRWIWWHGVCSTCCASTRPRSA